MFGLLLFLGYLFFMGLLAPTLLSRNQAYSVIGLIGAIAPICIVFGLHFYYYHAMTQNFDPLFVVREQPMLYFAFGVQLVFGVAIWFRLPKRSDEEEKPQP